MYTKYNNAYTYTNKYVYIFNTRISHLILRGITIVF